MISIDIKNTIPKAMRRYGDRLSSALLDGSVFLRDTIASRAVVLFMRDAQRERSESGGFMPRSPGDSGPLRILSGRLASSVLGRVAGGPQSNESIFEVQITRDVVRMKWGSTVPYARIQELGGIAGRGAVIPARPFLGPAIEMTRDEVPEILDPFLQRLATQEGL